MRGRKKGAKLKPTVLPEPQPETTGNQQDPVINMPVGKNDLMLLGLALREYRYQLSKNNRELPNAARVAVMQQLTALEQKVISNEISWDSLFGNG